MRSGLFFFVAAQMDLGNSKWPVKTYIANKYQLFDGGIVVAILAVCIRIVELYSEDSRYVEQTLTMMTLIHPPYPMYT